MLAVESSVTKGEGGGIEKKKKVKENNTGIEQGIKNKSKSERARKRERERRGGEIAKRDGAEKEPSEAILSLDS